ncbi:G patch domain-containing protein 2 isoform X1 [Diabrotica virgifera virgifera]|uniref:G patch domain-containing protein 2-like n=1 Tax=Diabrotica virgifera virgifera TaxID=50390 RepID=A0ABM5KR06_DIAVI|nr:G patch domain-containing protein 2 isoform X1 [Diabrotica virgifera virgifera]
MDHLAQDLSIALEETESCGSLNIINVGKWGMRRRTRSAGNLHLYTNKAGENRSDDSSSSNSEIRSEKHRSKLVSFHQSDSDDMTFSMTVDKTFNQRTLRMRHPMYNFLKGVSHCLESDSVNEHSPARPNIRRKRKFKRMSIDEAPMPPCGKRKRPQRLEIVDNGKSLRHSTKIKPLHQSLVDKIEKFCYQPNLLTNSMEIQSYDENCEIASESSISWSGGEGHEGDDELTDWAPSMESSSAMEPPFNDSDPREIRAGCRRLREERPGFSINTSANERVSKFLQDTSKSELRLYGAERDKLGQLAALYSLELWVESPNSTLLRKTNRTPSMQPTQRHHSGLSAVHKKIRTQSHHMIS